MIITKEIKLAKSIMNKRLISYFRIALLKNLNGYLLIKILLSAAKVSCMYNIFKPTIQEVNPDHLI